MKWFGGFMVVAGFFLLAGVAGSSDFYHECLATSGCVAQQQFTVLQELGLSLAGLFMLVVGVFCLKDD